MSINEMVQFIYDCAEDMSACDYCAFRESECFDKCEVGIKQWLMEEAE